MSHDRVDQTEHEQDHAHGGLGKYLVVGGCLGGLTAISFAAGSSEWIMSTPQLGWTIMMAVSCAKAMLVIMFFMHLLWEANWKYVLTIPVGMMALFLLLMLVPDIGLRTKKYSEERQWRAADIDPHALLERAAARDDNAPTDSQEHD